MDLETAQNNVVAKFSLLKQGDYVMWRLRIEQYFQIQDYALWDIIENGNSFNPKDAKTLFAAIQTRFGGNDATKKTQKTLLKQMYKNFNAPSTESLDSIFNRLQKIVSQLAILGENISQEDLNLKFLRSLPSKWNTHVVVWRNKPDLDSMSFDDLYNNFKNVEEEVKRTVTSSSNSGSQNMAFVSTPSSTNEVNTANVQVSTTNSSVSTASTHDNTANLSDATVYAFLANQPNGYQLVHEDLEQIHEDDLKEMDLKWQLALLSMRARRYYERTGKKITINGMINLLVYDKDLRSYKDGKVRSKCENKGIVPTEMELVLEYTQQGASHEVSDHLKMEMEMEIPSVKASANSDIIFFFTSAQDGNKLLDDERLSLADDLKKAHDQNQNKSK
ncbi:hypothetical protein Tco_0157090 [Tanacetum coccineum]